MGEMTSRTLDIDGVTLTPLRQIGDERGAVLHMMRNDDPQFSAFGECYFSEVRPGAIKAWKKHTRQSQYLAVPSGRIRFVIYDDREGSPTRGQVQTVELGRPDAYQRLMIPCGLWYGFACVGDGPGLIANCADLPHDPDESEVLSADDPSIPYDWSASSSPGPVRDGGVIRLSKSCLSAAERSAVDAVLEREFLGMGPEVQRFEEKLSEFFGRPALCVVNGTAALHLALQSLGLGPGDEVLVPSLTYLASFQAISATGAKPVACDIDPEFLILDWNDCRRRLTSKTRAIMPVHYSGGVGDLDALYAFAEENNLRVVEDAAHAFGTTYKGRKVGGFGDVACFSFDGIKNITSGEGGCVVSSDGELLQKVADARLLGVEKDSQQRYKGQRSWDFDVRQQGWRYHMSEVMAAIGQAQLDRFPGFSAARRRLAACYDRRLSRDSRFQPLRHDYNEVVPHIYVVRIPGLQDRQGLQARLLEQGIQVGIHYKPNHTLDLYRDSKAPPLPVTEKVFPTLLTLPLHPDLEESQVDLICDRLFEFLQ